MHLGYFHHSSRVPSVPLFSAHADIFYNIFQVFLYLNVIFSSKLSTEIDPKQKK